MPTNHISFLDLSGLPHDDPTGFRASTLYNHLPVVGIYSTYEEARTDMRYGAEASCIGQDNRTGQFLRFAL